MAASDQRDGLAVAEHGLATLVGDKHGLGQGIERPAEPDGLGTRLCDRFGRSIGGAFQMHEHFF